MCLIPEKTVLTEVEKINEFVKRHTGHPLGLVNSQMIVEFSSLIKEFNALKKKIEAFKVHWNVTA